MPLYQPKIRPKNTPATTIADEKAHQTVRNILEQYAVPDEFSEAEQHLVRRRQQGFVKSADADNQLPNQPDRDERARHICVFLHGLPPMAIAMYLQTPNNSAPF